MHFEFTPAAARAIAAAAAWTGRDDHDDLRVPELLLGLLDEPECRAALILAAHGVGERAIKDRFQKLHPVASADAARAERFSAEWNECLHAAASLLVDYPRPLVLATEHLLLGITAAGDEVAEWLAEQGLTAEKLEAEVHRLSGHEPGPLPLDDEGALEVDEPWSEARPVELESESLSPGDEMATLRTVDAAANRAGEGLRVVEDYLRFALDDGHLTSIAKSLRHELAAVLEAFPAADRHAARDTLADVGADLSLPSEQARQSPAAVAAASFKRVEQALRSLEEFSKPLRTHAATGFERLRYRVYTLERAAGLAADSLQRLAKSRLYVLVDGRESSDVFAELVASLVASGVSIIQLRDKQLSDRELVARARLLVQLSRDTGVLSIINDRPDVALVAGADGVHLGQDELSLKDARRVLGPRALVGRSTHSIEQARAAVLEGASYLGVGPTFPSSTKQFTSFTGVELLAAVHREIRLPAFAIGGITLENLPQVLEAGSSRIAVGAAITQSPNPAATTRQFAARLSSAGEQR